MLMTLVMITLAVSGGLYVGTIAWSAYKTAEFARTISALNRTGAINLV